MSTEQLGFENDQQSIISNWSPAPDLEAFTLPQPELDLSLNFDDFDLPSKPIEEKVQKRASNVLKLSQENEKLKAELKAMTDRLEQAERKREEIARRSQQKSARQLDSTAVGEKASG